MYCTLDYFLTWQIINCLFTLLLYCMPILSKTISFYYFEVLAFFAGAYEFRSAVPQNQIFIKNCESPLLCRQKESMSCTIASCWSEQLIALHLAPVTTNPLIIHLCLVNTIQTYFMGKYPSHPHEAVWLLPGVSDKVSVIFWSL